MIKDHLPVDHLNANLRRIGRNVDDATILTQAWKDGEFGLQIVWQDGYCTFVGMGPVATAVAESWLEPKH